MSDTALLDWCAENIKECNELESGCKVKLEVIYYDDDGNEHIVTGEGEDNKAAFRACIKKAIRQTPKK